MFSEEDTPAMDGEGGMKAPQGEYKKSGGRQRLGCRHLLPQGTGKRPRVDPQDYRQA